MTRRTKIVATLGPATDTPGGAGRVRTRNGGDAAALVVPTLSGRTARLVARHRPWVMVVAVAPTEAVLRSVSPVRMTPTEGGEDRMATAVRDAFAAGAVEAGDRVVVTAGHPIEGGRRFPTIRVVRVGDGGSCGEP